MSAKHEVAQGEHLASIAALYGFSDWHAIWDYPGNKALKSKRVNPNVLYPGDILAIPDLETRDFPGATEKRHTFVLTRPPLRLRLVIEDLNGKPVANAICTVEVERKSLKLTTDSNGLLECDIEPDAREGKVLEEQSDGAGEVKIPFLIGHLDPVDELSGIQARLHNLGYLREADGGVDEETLRGAIEEFQADHGMVVDGDPGPAFRSRLKEVHGC